MSLTLNTIKPKAGSRTKRFRVGRGEGTGSGKTAGRGTKGQRARSGGRNKLKMKGVRAMLLSFPKLRGFRSRYVKAGTVSLERASKVFSAKETIDLRALKAKNLLSRNASSAKLVGKGPVEKVLNFSGIKASETAKAAVEKAGGSFILPKKSKSSKKR